MFGDFEVKIVTGTGSSAGTARDKIATKVPALTMIREDGWEKEGAIRERKEGTKCLST